MYLLLLYTCALMVVIWVLIYLLDEDRVKHEEKEIIQIVWTIFSLLFFLGSLFFVLATIDKQFNEKESKEKTPQIQIENNTQTVPDNVQNINITPPK